MPHPSNYLGWVTHQPGGLPVSTACARCKGRLLHLPSRKEDSEAEHIGGRAPTHRHQSNSDHATNRRQATKASHPPQAHHERHPQEGDNARSTSIARSGKGLGFHPAYELGEEEGKEATWTAPTRRVRRPWGRLRCRGQQCRPRISSEPPPTSSLQTGPTPATEGCPREDHRRQPLVEADGSLQI